MTDRLRRKLKKKSRTLESTDLDGLAKYIQSNQCKNIVLMLGAGVSTSAGIPDFRSPKTGLYSNLARLNLPHPEAVFEINFFRRNPVPFYTLAHELYPGKFRPTPAHSFIRLLHDKGLLFKCFTQNIDTLERRAGVPDHKIIEAHGSFATQRCIDCLAPYDDFLLKVHIKEKTIPRCEGCQGLVKPDIVFFGESLPREFINSVPLLPQADLLIVMGTSLTVHPFAMLATMVKDDCPRVLINLERVGDFSHRMDDVLLLGKCDDMIRKLCQELGWEEELDELWKITEESVEKEEVVDGEGKHEASQGCKAGDKKNVGKDDQTQQELDKLVAAIDRSLTVSDERQKSVPVGAADSEKEDNTPLAPQPGSTTNSADNKGTSKSRTTGEGKL